ncbi:MAG: phosphoadenylyl-sulfate reductase [Dehalococcoidales bacterium]|nr:phosphoadenylyl-sulfate reductase [Dehalococcoidales bacterium]
MVGENNSDTYFTRRDKAEQVLRSAIEEFHPAIILASSFSLEDVVLMHMISKIRTDARVFAIDTGRLNEETYRCAEEVRGVTGLKIEWLFPRFEDVQKLEQEKGLFSFQNSLEDRHECCQIRKVEPLMRVLNGQKAWITGLRKEQNVTREELKYVEIDDVHQGITKINPLLDWDDQDLKRYIKENNLPYCSLYDRGYTSIGCAPCTRATKPGEHPRAGRWWWETPEQKECGLHVDYFAEKGLSVNA